VITLQRVNLISCSNFFERVLGVVDDALNSAADTKNKTSEGTDKKFEEAINELSAYERECHKKQK